VKEELDYPFLKWTQDELVKFAAKFDREKTGIVDTEFVILDEQTLKDKTVVLVTPSEIEDGVTLAARSDFRSSLVTLNAKSIGVGGDEPWEEAAEGGGVIRIYGENPSSED